jgi:hypothetical protein
MRYSDVLLRAAECINEISGPSQKAIDYIGDLAEFDRQFKVHAQIAKAYGNYKVSVHSGSDKFAVYPTVGRETGGYLHLKTAGTSWLVAVTVIAEYDPALYRKMHKAALANFNDMLKLYHITADLSRIPALDSLPDSELPALIDSHPDARQLLHITYGPILTGPLREPFFAAMHKWEEDYAQALEKHFDKHFSRLGIPNDRFQLFNENGMDQFTEIGGKRISALLLQDLSVKGVMTVKISHQVFQPLPYGFVCVFARVQNEFRIEDPIDKIFLIFEMIVE